MTATGTKVLRLLAADDEPVLREALTDLFANEPSVELVAMASDASQAIFMAQEWLPDVALLDVRMPGGGGSAAARGISRCSPETRIVAYSAYDDRSSVMEMIRAGAVGYVVKGTTDDPVDAVINAAHGQRILSAEVLAEIIEELHGRLEDDEEQVIWKQDATSRVLGAIGGQGLSIVYQPIVRIDDGVMIGAEALARFSGGPHLTPDGWFTDAAEVGLLRELECAAIERALDGLEMLPEDVYLSVNLSPTTLTSLRFAQMARQMPLNRLVLEVTEHAHIDDYDELAAAIWEFRKGGARFAVDDAGAGFSSMRHILQIVPAVIKLDISLVRGVDADPARRAVVAGFVALAREIGASIVAEGIETQEELSALRVIGVSSGQGYFLSRPTDLPVRQRYAVGPLDG